MRQTLCIQTRNKSIEFSQKAHIKIGRQKNAIRKLKAREDSMCFGFYCENELNETIHIVVLKLN